jgi:TfoX/Sxy family transcriptional regulator of competence genes
MAQPYLDMLSKMITNLGIPSSVDASLECKHFFSGAALYANGKICASLTPAGFGLKLPADVRNRLIEDGEGNELRYFETAPVKKEYITLSQSVVDNLERLKQLVNLSIGYATENEGAA